VSFLFGARSLRTGKRDRLLLMLGACLVVAVMLSSYRWAS
jgi:hypothetical protein